MMIVEAPFIGTRTTSRAVVFRDHPAAVPDGAVVGHPLLGDLSHIHTSELFAIGEAAGWARTWSRYYRLGSRKNDPPRC